MFSFCSCISTINRRLSRLSTVLLESIGSTRSIICIGSTVKIHEEIVPYLPAANRLTGCDSVPMHFGIGKIKVCSVIAKSPLQLLGEEKADIDKVIQQGEMFV